jgi:homoserine dehydrogenase
MIKIAILGYGTIGSGVAETLDINRDIIAARAGEEVEVKYVLDLRDFPGQPVQEKIVHDISVIQNDSEISIVVETMGGTNPAYDFVKSMLESKKSVVTSNKELVAAHGAELMEIAAANHVNFFFEASVGGGIPIIRPLNTSLTPDDVQEITGILNGTTNYILTKMDREGLSFAEVLKEAQDLGYAERDPSADVEGGDACRKIAILSSLAYGRQVVYTDIHTEGITNITPEDFQYAAKLGMSIKLLGSSKKVNGQVYAMVAPKLVANDSPLYAVSDVYNAVMVQGNIVGTLMFYGSGAGKFPTAAAVVADVIEAVKHADYSITVSWGKEKLELADWKATVQKFMVRLPENADKAQVETLLSPEKTVQLEGQTEYAVITKPMSESEFIQVQEQLGCVISRIRVA